MDEDHDSKLFAAVAEQIRSTLTLLKPVEMTLENRAKACANAVLARLRLEGITLIRKANK